MQKQILQEGFNSIVGEGEVLILWVGQYIVIQTGESYDQLTNKASY